MIKRTESEIMKKWVEKANNPLVSIICTSYNHEKYISDALDSFVMQETTFPFEIIIHDDASEDNTQSIIKLYEKRYSNIIKAIYEKENQYSKHNGAIRKIINSKTKGKYVAYCEGDDYWIDKNKLQKQISFLEKNQNCSLILTNCYEENVITKTRTEGNPYCNIERNSTYVKIDTKDVILEKGSLPPTCSIVASFSMIKKMPSFFNEAPVGDRPLRFFLASVGDVYLLNEITCVHRANVVGSFADRANSKEYATQIYNGMIEFYNKYNEYTDNKYNEEIEYTKSDSQFVYYTRTNNVNGLLHNSFFINNFSLFNKIKIIILLTIPKNVKKSLRKILK